MEASIADWVKIVDEHEDVVHLVAAVTKPVALSCVICQGVTKHFEGRLKKSWYHGHEALYVDTPKGQKVIIFCGAGRSNSGEGFRGEQLGSAYLLTPEKYHRNFVDQVQSRMLASSNARIFTDQGEAQFS